MKKLLIVLILLAVCVSWSQAATKLEVVDYVNAYIYCHDGTYYYGVKSGLAGTKLVRGTDYSNMTEVHDFATEAAGMAVNMAWSTGPGVVFAFTKISGTSKAFLYKSSDSGATWTRVLRLGDIDGTDENQIADVDILPRGFLNDAAHNQLLVGEYNYNSSRTPGGTNDQVRLMKSTNGGDNWVEVTHWNTDGATHQVRHIHGLAQDPYTNDIYILFGEAESGMLRWNGVDNIAANLNPEDYDSWADNGVFGVEGSANRIYVDLLFTEGDAFGFADTSTGSDGIYRIAKDLSTFTLVDNTVAGYTAHTGAYGVKTTSGNLYFIEYLLASPTDNQINIYNSSDSGSSFSIVGKYGTTGGPHSTRQFQQIGDYIFISAAGSGKSDISTAVVREDGTYAEQEPVILHPVYWVATTGTDSTTYPNGYRPSSPWATLSYALTGDRITYGARVIVGAGTYDDQNKILTDWDGNVREGSGTTVIEGAGMESTLHRHKAGDDANYTVYVNDTTANLLWKDIGIDDKSVTTYMFRQQKSPSSEYRRVKFGSKNYARAGGAQFAPFVNTYSKIDQCKFLGTDNTDAMVSGGNGATLIVTRTVFDGFDDIMYVNGYTGVTLQFLNNTAYNYDNRGITFGIGTTFTTLSIKNNIFYGQVAYQDIVDIASLTESDAQIDYNLYIKGTTNLANSGGTHRVTADPRFTTAAEGVFTLSPGSPAINAGIAIDGLTTDFLGNPIKGLPDIGSYEYQGGSNRFPDFLNFPSFPSW